MTHRLTYKTTNFREDFDLFPCQSLFLRIALKNGDKIWDYLSADYEGYHILDMIPCTSVNTDILKKSAASDFHGRFIPKSESVRKRWYISTRVHDLTLQSTVTFGPSWSSGCLLY
jgi:hypothetical protein